MYRAANFFTAKLTLLTASLTTEEKEVVLGRVLRSALVWVRMMVVEVQSELSMCQWFLWLQVTTRQMLVALGS